MNFLALILKLFTKKFVNSNPMIETDFYILSQEQYDECYTEASKLGMNIDHYLLEFCEVEGPYITVS